MDVLSKIFSKERVKSFVFAKRVENWNSKLRLVDLDPTLSRCSLKFAVLLGYLQIFSQCIRSSVLLNSMDASEENAATSIVILASYLWLLDLVSGPVFIELDLAFGIRS